MFPPPPPPPIIDLPPPLRFRTRIKCISFLVKVLGDSLQSPTKYSGFRFNTHDITHLIRMTTKLAHIMFQVLMISKSFNL